MKRDADGKELLESVEGGERKSAGGKRERTCYSRYAKVTFRKDQRLNIRLSSRDLEAKQKRALAENLSYQTLISSLLHEHPRAASKRCSGEQGPRGLSTIDDRRRTTDCATNLGAGRTYRVNDWLPIAADCRTFFVHREDDTRGESADSRPDAFARVNRPAPRRTTGYGGVEDGRAHEWGYPASDDQAAASGDLRFVGLGAGHFAVGGVRSARG